MRCEVGTVWTPSGRLTGGVTVKTKLKLPIFNDEPGLLMRALAG